MTQKERQEHSRGEIYRAALEEFGTNGYNQVNMERILRQPRDFQGDDVSLLLQ